MKRSTRELGVAKRSTVLIVSLATAVLGGVAYKMSGNSLNMTKNAKATQPAATFTLAEPPKLGDDPVKEAVGNHEVENIKKGEMVQYRDESGNVVYRKVEPVTGVTGTGKPLSFQMTVRPSPVPMAKFKGVGEKGDKQVKKKLSAATPPKYTMTNGKLTPAPAGANNAGATEKKTK